MIKAIDLTVVDVRRGQLTLALQYKGFNYTSYYNGAFEDADSFAALSQTEANAVALNLQYGIDSVNSIVYADPSYTDSLDALSSTIQEALGYGLSVMVVRCSISSIRRGIPNTIRGNGVLISTRATPTPFSPVTNR